MKEAITPSEIIVGTRRREAGPTEVRPWIRLLARAVDCSLFSAVLCLSTPLSLGRYSFLLFLLWVPIESLLLATWGTTLGKWILRIELKRGYANRLSLSRAWRRSFSVWFRGLGMGLPIANVICLLLSYYQLQNFRTTRWDRDEGIRTIHHPIAPWCIYCALFIAIPCSLFFCKKCIVFSL